MKRAGLNIRLVKAIFVSHEHGDHVHGVSALSKKYKVPVFATAMMWHQSPIDIPEHLIRTINADEPVSVGDLSITSFRKEHDACDPQSFVVSSQSVSVGVFTDIGRVCDNVVRYFRTCHAAFLETNYDESLLHHGSYPFHLKKRITGGKGHLSNDQALSLFTRHRAEFMTHLFLSHLSEDNNRPKIALDLFKKHSGSVEIVVASRDCESKLYHIRNTFRRTARQAISDSHQMTLF